MVQQDTQTPENTAGNTHVPVVAVVGRPNVGKSTLINRFLGSRQAIVDDMPGVTRDRAYYDAEWQGKHFALIDTGGLLPEEAGEQKPEDFTRLVNQQIQLALEEADVVLFVVDGRSGITAIDEAVAHKVRQAGKPVFLVVNKIDRKDQEALAAEFYALGLGTPLPVSAMHGTVGVGDLLDTVMAELPKVPEQEVSGAIRFTLAGRPNVGKSSIANALLGKQRTIVSNVPGTTRDAIDVDFNDGDQEFTLVDTAGIRKKGKVGYGVEMFSVDRSLRAIRDSDVTVVVLDATENLEKGVKDFITDQDKKIIEASNEAGRALVLVVNKWDLVPDKTPNTTEEYKKIIHNTVPHARWAPVVFTSALTGQRLTKVLDVIREVYANSHRRIQTSVLNQLVNEAVALTAPPIVKNRQLKVLYATQARVAPPTFVLFVNDAKLLKDQYRRYLEKRFRENIELTGTPVAIVARNRGE